MKATHIPLIRTADLRYDVILTSLGLVTKQTGPFVIFKLPCFRVFAGTRSVSFSLLQMATFKSNSRTGKSVSTGCSGIFLLLVANCHFVGKLKSVDLQWHSMSISMINLFVDQSVCLDQSGRSKSLRSKEKLIRCTV